MSIPNPLPLIPWLYNLTQRPKLEIPDDPDLINWRFQSGVVWKFANLEITNRKSQTAQRCVAVAEIIKHPVNVTLSQKVYALHWADVPFSTMSTGAEPVDIGGGPHRLDVAFTIPHHSGALMAIPIALTLQHNATQAYLPPGEYILRVKVTCENGRGDTKQFKLTSPNNWQGLDMKMI